VIEIQGALTIESLPHLEVEDGQMRIQSESSVRWWKNCSRVAWRWTAFAVAVGVVGCAAHQSATTGAQASAQADALNPVDRAASAGATDQGRLEELWQKRVDDGLGSDFTLGPGDVLEVSVPLEQLEQREIRVSPLDTITLPLAGVVDVRGMTEQNLTDTLRQRLSKYMYDPPISLFVKHYGSREVAVMGAVAKPGLYTLASGSDTLMGMISKAGGMTPDAAAKVILVPSRGGGRVSDSANYPGVPHVIEAGMPSVDFTSHSSNTGPQEAPNEQLGDPGPLESERIESGSLASAERPSLHAQSDPSAAGVTTLHPLVIAINDPTMRNYLELPARPGDAIIVPAAGEVTVGGWVRSPGGFPITPGMTALSAISAAGGALFSSSAQILRTANDGERATTRIDISHIQKGEEADVPVQSGDVVMVDKSALGAVPYAAYTVLSKFGTGMYIPVP
jgi:protein involved in polysaccharide export with SLBB domain